MFPFFPTSIASSPPKHPADKVEKGSEMVRGSLREEVEELGLSGTGRVKGLAAAFEGEAARRGGSGSESEDLLGGGD